MRYSVLLQSFGNEQEYRRAVFCLLSLLRFRHLPNLEHIIIFTDSTDYFTRLLNGISIKFIHLSSEKIISMRGDINFLHRMKIAMIEEAFRISNGIILYVDSDTFFLDNPEQFISSITSEISGMHKREYPIKDLKDMPLPAGQTFRAFYDLILKGEFAVSNNSTLKISPELFSWNAGTMALHPSHQKLIPDVYLLTDQFYPKTLNHASEQYAFSITLQTETEIKPMDGVIYHYWYKVKKQIVDKLLLKNIGEIQLLETFDQKLQAINELTQRLPTLLENHIWTLRDNAIQAFHSNNFRVAYKYAFQAMIKRPFNLRFYIDLGYHIKRHLRMLNKK